MRPNESDTLGPEGAPPLALADWLAAWAAHGDAADKSVSYITHGVGAVARAAREEGWTRPDQITPEAIEKWLLRMKRQGRLATTRNLALCHFRRFCAFLIGRRALPGPDGRPLTPEENPARAAPRARVLRRKARLVPTEAQVQSLIAVARSDWRKKDRWLVYLTASTAGHRWGTLRDMEWGWLREDASPPYFDLPAHAVKPKEPKTVWMTAELAAALREHRRAAGDRARVFLAMPKHKSFLRDLARAGIDRGTPGKGPTMSFHSLRHFASNRAKWLGLTDEQRSKLLGHADQRMVQDVYTDPAAVELGRQTFALPPLLPPELSTSSMPRRKGVDRRGGLDDTGGVEALTMNDPTLHTDRIAADCPGGSCRRPQHLMGMLGRSAESGLPLTKDGARYRCEHAPFGAWLGLHHPHNQEPHDERLGEDGDVVRCGRRADAGVSGSTPGEVRGPASSVPASRMGGGRGAAGTVAAVEAGCHDVRGADGAAEGCTPRQACAAEVQAVDHAPEAELDRHLSPNEAAVGSTPTGGSFSPPGVPGSHTPGAPSSDTSPRPAITVSADAAEGEREGRATQRLPSPGTSSPATELSPTDGGRGTEAALSSLFPVEAAPVLARLDDAECRTVLRHVVEHPESRSIILDLIRRAKLALAIGSLLAAACLCLSFICHEETVRLVHPW